MDGNERKMAAGRYSIELEREAKERQLSGLKNVGSSVSFDTDDVDFAKSRDKAAEKFNESPAALDAEEIKLREKLDRGELSPAEKCNDYFKAERGKVRAT